MPALEPRAMRHAAIVDAGSSGTRIYIYGWREYRKGDPSPPQIEELLNAKVDGGIAKIIPEEADKFEALKAQTQDEIKKAVEERVKDHLNSLFNHGRAFCAGARIATTSVPLYLLATAGMRELRDRDDTHGKKIYNALLECLKKFTAKNESGFDAKECGAITGEAEALYGWIAANYSLGSFSGYGLRASQTVGYVELGGASAQIAYNLVMNNATSVSKAAAVASKVDQKNHSERTEAIKGARATLAAGDLSGGLDDYNGRLLKVNLGALEYYLFLGSYRLGSSVAREEFNRFLIANHKNGDGNVEDFSRNKGCDPEVIQKETFVGAADYSKLKEIVKEIVTSNTEDDTIPREKKLYSPIANEIPNADIIQSPNRSFVGGSSFWYNTRGVFGLDKNGKPKKSLFSFDEYEEEIELNFKLSWEFALARRKDAVKPNFLRDSGFTAAWVQHILFECFKFKRGDTAVTHEDKLTFRPYNGSEGAELSWTLGRIVLHSMDGELTQMSGDHAREFNKEKTSLRVEEDKLRKLDDKLYNLKYLLKFGIKEQSDQGNEIMKARMKAHAEEPGYLETVGEQDKVKTEYVRLGRTVERLTREANEAFNSLEVGQRFIVPLGLPA